MRMQHKSSKTGGAGHRWWWSKEEQVTGGISLAGISHREPFSRILEAHRCRLRLGSPPPPWRSASASLAEIRSGSGSGSGRVVVFGVAEKICEEVVVGKIEEYRVKII
ncbi:hypothetical protein L1987_00785 [Smallanthus sonchifolius]|uniref:Uncharacterized protein n=1 Tax=Smallanthus sonchifolius TaxID=185202 RepID=A0ACB9K3A9_9ASTR|nr:hypothetical protein L1987_00785 [Smallanthus sonchifolius]